MKAYGVLKADHTPSDFLNAVLHKFYSTHSWIFCIISNVGSCCDGLQKYLKSKKTRIFAQICQRRCFFFLDLELEQALFYVKNLPSWNTTNFTYYLSYNFPVKSLSFFSRLKSSIIHLSVRKLVLIPGVFKRICHFSLLICHVKETSKHHQWKFKVHIINL